MCQLVSYMLNISIKISNKYTIRPSENPFQQAVCYEEPQMTARPESGEIGDYIQFKLSKM